MRLVHLSFPHVVLIQQQLDKFNLFLARLQFEGSFDEGDAAVRERVIELMQAVIVF